MQEYKHTTIQSRSFVEKTLTYHEEIAMQTLVVNLPSREMPNMPRKSFHQQVHLTLKDQIPNKGAKIRPHKSELCCDVQMREKHPQYIVYHDL
jgi:hypothetical protein